ncbi:WhiB family transcriptional regulator [Microlunatus soli]|uniref:Sigma-70, region 4 n=1 Tax=Microlunatus soli TaxID=630515 RepID=A0A1H1TI77_9ACTN|nr:WhiB family transcriptional regulator [Microlunatus soli]SDS59912.1 Sigma-70, region 4 [Microlunatus soli]
MSEFDDNTQQSVTGCVRFASLFQDRLLEEPPTSSAPAALRHRYTNLTERAGEICGECPIRQSCLYDAVVHHDVAGYVAGTTQRQRGDIRRRLGVNVDGEDFDTFAGATARNRPVDHEEVVRLRRANPDETLESIAQRLGCSLSTVKRHLRRERAADHGPTEVRSGRRQLPTLAQVMAAAAQVVGPIRAHLRRAA